MAELIPKKWWQWLLLYPTIIVSIFGAVPHFFQVYQSYSLGIPVSKLQIAIEQRKLWEKNIECLIKTETYKIELPDHTYIETTMCQSGDVLFRHKRPDGSSVYLWLGYDTFKKTSFLENLIPEATAETLHKMQEEMLLQRSVHTKCLSLKLRNVYWTKKQDEVCVSEKIDIYTGAGILFGDTECSSVCGE